jgi:hypothetical protein
MEEKGCCLFVALDVAAFGVLLRRQKPLALYLW